MHSLAVAMREILNNLCKFVESFFHRKGNLPTIPDDILRHIFILSLPISHNPVLSIHNPPLLLLRVCRNWNLVAISTPRLWTSIHIAAPNLCETTDNQNWDNLDNIFLGIERISLKWLSRSSEHPVKISYSGDDRNCGHSAQDTNRTSPLTNISISLFRRLDTLQLECPYEVGRILDWEVYPDELPFLCSLELYFNFDMSNFQSRAKSNIFRAPNLRSVNLVGFPASLTVLALNWAQLTHLSIQTTELVWEEVAFILRSCRILSSFSLGALLFWSDRPPVHGHRIACPHLSKLAISEFLPLHYEDAPYNRLDLSQLHRFEFFRMRNTPTGILSLFVATMGSIRHFITNPCLTPPDELIGWLRNCPRLESLSLVPGTPVIGGGGTQVHEGINGTLFQLLIKGSDGEGYLCPNLARFECLVGSKFSDRELHDFIVAKQSQNDPRISKLTDLVVFFQRPHDPHSVDLAKVLALSRHQDGLKSKIRYGCHAFICGELWQTNSELHAEGAYKYRPSNKFNPFSGLIKHERRGIRLGVFGGQFKL